MARRRAHGISWPLVAGLVLLPLEPTLAQQRAAPQAESGPQHPQMTRVADGLLARRPTGGSTDLAPVRFDPASAPLPLRYNNYLSIKRSGSSTLPGQTGADDRGFVMFDDPAYAVRAFIELVRGYHDRGGARSALDIFRQFAPPGDCAGAPPPRPEGGGCSGNEVQPPISAARAARAVGLGPENDLRLFGSGGEVNEGAMRALLDAAATQEIGPPYCPQPPRGERWLGCHIDDGLYQRALALLSSQPPQVTAQQAQPQGRAEQQSSAQQPHPQTGASAPGVASRGSAGAPPQHVVRIIGTDVVGADDRSVGKIENLLIDARGTVRAAVVGWGGIFGLGARHALVPMERIQLGAAEGERAHLGLSREQFDTLPRFDQSQLGDYGRDHGWGADLRLAR